MELNSKIRGFIETNLVILRDDTVINDDENLFEKDCVNSLFVLRLLNYIEKEFEIVVEHDDMDIANFNSVNRIARLIRTKRSSSNC